MGQRVKLVSSDSPLKCCKAMACSILTICISLCANVMCVSQASLFDSAAGSRSLASLASAWTACRSSLSSLSFRIVWCHCLVSCICAASSTAKMATSFVRGQQSRQASVEVVTSAQKQAQCAVMFSTQSLLFQWHMWLNANLHTGALFGCSRREQPLQPNSSREVSCTSDCKPFRILITAGKD